MAQTSPGMEPHRAQWKTRIGFLLAAAGSAVGLGNIWRFPYLAYQHGGGAFLVPYVIALLTAGIPLLILEFGLGHKMRGSAPMSFAKANPHWEWLGWWMVTFVMFGIVLYYSVVIAWCVCYLGYSLTLAWGPDPNAFFFQQFLGATAGPHVIGDIRSPILLGLVIVWLVNWACVFFGVEEGIERANKVFMPLLFLLLLILVGWTMTLPGAWDGIGTYLKPDFAKLAKPTVWIDAYSQAFFSLSVGFGIMIVYASYLPRHTDINRSAFQVAAMDTLVAFIAGLAVFGTLGYMMTKTGKPLTELVQHGIGLAFVAYPQAISLLPGLSSVFGAVFFLTLIFAGITSSMSILEAFAAAVIDKFHYPRKVVVTVLSIAGFLGGIIFATGGGLPWLDIVDHALSHYGLFLACLLQCLVVGWLAKGLHLREHVNEHSSFPLGRGFEVLVRFVIPAVILVLLGNDLTKDMREPYSGYPWLAIILIGRDWLVVTLIAALFVAMRPWRKPLDRQ